jgi:hypothetical protein
VAAVDPAVSAASVMATGGETTRRVALQVDSSQASVVALVVVVVVLHLLLRKCLPLHQGKNGCYNGGIWGSLNSVHGKMGIFDAAWGV